LEHVGVVQQTSAELRSLEPLFEGSPSKRFLSEVIDCFESGANRAAAIMCWILALDHMLEYIFEHQLENFNASLAANPDKKIKKVVTRDDFGDLKEIKIIEVARAANIISNDVRKILDEALGIRNTAAHPSSVQVSRSKVVSLIEDLVLNVIQKYPL
jgi:hypothetical protein